MPEESSGTETPGISSQLAQLVPSFDPAVDTVEGWSQRIELLLHAWPEQKLKELGTRIILGTKGSAFQKLQLRQEEVLTGTKEGIKRAVEIVGGQFGQVELERKYEIVEKALFRCQQKQDETSDSYLARADVAWTEVLMKKIQMQELQAYIVMRGSRLSPDDKKRVLVEAGAEAGGILDMKRVSAAVRMIGSQFFSGVCHGQEGQSSKDI